MYWCLAQFCLQWVVHTQSRERLRNKYGLEAAPCSDCCVTFWCVRLHAWLPTFAVLRLVKALACAPAKAKQSRGRGCQGSAKRPRNVLGRHTPGHPRHVTPQLQMHLLQQWRLVLADAAGHQRLVDDTTEFVLPAGVLRVPSARRPSRARYHPLLIGVVC